MIITDSSAILISKEGMAQGVPSAMKSYAIGLLPLILKLKHSSEFVKSQWDIAKTYPKGVVTGKD